jgi:O-acetyl-ADP-ribose deacetylase
MAPFPVQLNEVCKVRNAAVARTGSGYSLAIVKKTNKASVHITLLDAKYSLTDTFTVKLDTLWKLKSSQRKSLVRKVLKANTPPSVNETVAPPVEISPPIPPPLYVEVEEHDNSIGHYFVHNLNCVAKLTLGGSDTTFLIANDSVVKFTGDAIVNAANEGCLGGGGIDGEVNYQGGIELENARKQLPLLDSPYNCKRCDTGDAKITIAGSLPCEKVIHAVGPRFGYDYEFDHDDNLNILENAYKNSMLRARESGLKTVAFCILSAGIFRGNCPLKTVIKRGMDAIAKNTYPGLEQVVFCAFTSNEQMELDSILKDIAKDIGEMGVTE